MIVLNKDLLTIGTKRLNSWTRRRRLIQIMRCLYTFNVPLISSITHVSRDGIISSVTHSSSIETLVMSKRIALALIRGSFHFNSKGVICNPQPDLVPANIIYYHPKNSVDIYCNKFQKLATNRHVKSQGISIACYENVHRIYTWIHTKHITHKHVC